jgi:SAM-dependent methyltransferase
MQKDLIKDIIGWDVVNWSKAIEFWEQTIPLKQRNFKCLELGGIKGGLSLWLSLQGNQVVCSDLENPEKQASVLLNKYKAKATFEAIDATKIPYENHFDVIAFKSILGGISRNNNHSLKKKTIDEIYKALNEKGVLLFAENLEASLLHKFLRKYFIKWGHEWNYLHVDEVSELFQSFKRVTYITVGFFAAFGRNEMQRNFLGRIDQILNPIIPKKMKYIVIGIAEK